MAKNRSMVDNQEDPIPMSFSPVPFNGRIGAPLNVQVLYMNSLAIATTASDVSLTVMVNGLSTHQIFMAFPTAKSLFLALEKAISEHEKIADVKILDIAETQKIIKANKK